MNYVYIRSEPSLWTVGFYEPDGKWNPESDHGSKDAAAERVNYLNGGSDSAAIKDLREKVAKLQAEIRYIGSNPIFE